MTVRNNDSYQTYITKFLNDLYVVCPKCAKQALVRSEGQLYKLNTHGNVRFICTNCGHNKTIGYSSSILYSSAPRPEPGQYILIGTWLDPFFHLPLWLTAQCCGNTLWAYNYEHLAFIESYVEAKLRERNGIKPSNQSIGSRLPRWMILKKNRDGLIRSIKTLQQKH